jgi:steroid delta-isomerase-like uncharacterized protein
MSVNSELLDTYIERYNAGDLDGVMDLYADDAVQIMPDGMFEGKDAIRARLALDLEACPTYRHTVRSFVEQGDSFCDEWTFAGTHDGPFTLPDGTQVPATGRPVEVNGMEFCQVRDGKLTVDNLYYDNLALATQIGLIPQTATA